MFPPPQDEFKSFRRQQVGFFLISQQQNYSFPVTVFVVQYQLPSLGCVFIPVSLVICRIKQILWIELDVRRRRNHHNIITLTDLTSNLEITHLMTAPVERTRTKRSWRRVARRPALRPRGALSLHTLLDVNRLPLPPQPASVPGPSSMDTDLWEMEVCH